MSRFLFKRMLFGYSSTRTTSPPTRNLVGFVENPDFFPLRLFSSSSNQQSFRVSYLINSFGFSPDSALSASKHVNFNTFEKPDKFIKMFKKYGFTQTQISNLVRRNPDLLGCHAEKSILPKLEFLEAKGISGPEMAKILSSFPSLLSRSLVKRIIPSYEFVRNFFKSEQKAIAAVKRFPDILKSVEKCVEPNISILREHGVPDSKIATMMQYWPRCVVVNPCDFRKVVEKVEGMGFDASKVTFVVAVIALSMNESIWESKVDEYKKWGWSEEDILNAFKKNPWCMRASKDKLMACMDFFINQMGWRPCHLAKYPTIFGLSLKKRVVPRCSVFQVLLSKGLVKEEVSLNVLLITSDKKFLQKFVVPYEEEAPELLKLYEQKLDLSNATNIDEVGKLENCVVTSGTSLEVHIPSFTAVYDRTKCR